MKDPLQEYFEKKERSWRDIVTGIILGGILWVIIFCTIYFLTK